MFIKGKEKIQILGSGTTTKAAKKTGRNSIGIELKHGYLKVIRERLNLNNGDFNQSNSVSTKVRYENEDTTISFKNF